MNETFKYEPVYMQPGNFAVLFKPQRKYAHVTDKTAWRRFALCGNETDAKTLCAAMNKYDSEGHDWVKESIAEDNKHLCA